MAPRLKTNGDTEGGMPVATDDAPMVVSDGSVSVATDAPVSVESALLVPEPPTLTDAFRTVRAALQGVFADNLPILDECNLMQALYSDGNVAVAWRHAILLLEQAVNAPLRQ